MRYFRWTITFVVIFAIITALGFYFFQNVGVMERAELSGWAKNQGVVVMDEWSARMVVSPKPVGDIVVKEGEKIQGFYTFRPGVFRVKTIGEKVFRAGEVVESLGLREIREEMKNRRE